MKKLFLLIPLLTLGILSYGQSNSIRIANNTSVPLTVIVGVATDCWGAGAISTGPFVIPASSSVLISPLPGSTASHMWRGVNITGGGGIAGTFDNPCEDCGDSEPAGVTSTWLNCDLGGGGLPAAVIFD